MSQYITNYSSPVGEISAVSDGEHITGLWFTDQVKVRVHLEPDPVRADLSVFHALGAWLERYFDGGDPGPCPPMELRGTAFQKAIWAMLLDIPYGGTTTYGALARKLGRPMSAQAVGGAVGSNPIAILAPCHRVVGAGGKLTGYAGGLHRKEALLRLEGIL